MTLPNTVCIKCGRKLDAFIDGYRQCADIFECTNAEIDASMWLAQLDAEMSTPFDFEEGEQAIAARDAKPMCGTFGVDAPHPAHDFAEWLAEAPIEHVLEAAAFVNPPRPQSYREKVAHVRSQGQTRNHTCHWPSCTEQVPPAMWGCRTHWFRLPKHLRDKIWSTYRAGQEISMRPSRAYLDAAEEVQRWIEDFLTRDDRSTRYVAPRDARCTACGHPDCAGRNESDCWSAVGENPPAARYGFSEDDQPPRFFGDLD